MAYYNVCPHCGCNLDPGEKCDCESIKAREQETSRAFYSQFLRANDSNGQMRGIAGKVAKYMLRLFLMVE